MTKHIPTLVTQWHDKADTTEFHTHLWYDNGHDTFSKHEELEATSSLEEAQAEAALELGRLQQRSHLQGLTGTWWADIQRGTWAATHHESDDEIILDATWETDGHPQWTSYPADGQVAWQQIQ